MFICCFLLMTSSRWGRVTGGGVLNYYWEPRPQSWRGKLPDICLQIVKSGENYRWQDPPQNIIFLHNVLQMCLAVCQSKKKIVIIEKNIIWYSQCAWLAPWSSHYSVFDENYVFNILEDWRCVLSDNAARQWRSVCQQNRQQEG